MKGGLGGNLRLASDGGSKKAYAQAYLKRTLHELDLDVRARPHRSGGSIHFRQSFHVTTVYHKCITSETV